MWPPIFAKVAPKATHAPLCPLTQGHDRSLERGGHRSSNYWPPCRFLRGTEELSLNLLLGHYLILSDVDTKVRPSGL